MNVEIYAEAALFPEKEYINGIAVAVQFMNIHRWQYFRGHTDAAAPEPHWNQYQR
jgi:hypothetical protein